MSRREPAGATVDHVPVASEQAHSRWASRATVLDLLVIAAFWLLYFWPFLVTRSHLIPYDLLDQHYMFQQFVHRALVTGQSPLWSPNILSGYPIAADPLTQLFYPPNLVMHLLFPGELLPYLALEWLATLHVLSAAIGGYFLARSLAGSRAGGLLAALVFGFGSFFAWHVAHLSPISTLSWLPWILLGYRRLLAARSLGWVALTGLLVGLMTLAGHALTIVQVGYLLLTITALACWLERSAGPRAVLRVGVLGVAPLVLGAGLAAVQLLPSLALSGQTERAALAFQEASSASFLPHFALTVLLPNFFSFDGPGKYWAAGDVAETNGYVGLLPLLLAGIGLAWAPRRSRRTVALIAAGTIVSLLLAFGAQTWLYRLAFDLLPAVDQVRRPTNFIALTQLGLALLAAFGLAAIEHDGRGAVLDQLAGWLGRSVLAAALVLVVAALALAAAAGEAHADLTAVANGLVLALVILLAGYLLVRAVRAWQLSRSILLGGLLLIAAFDVGSATAGKVYGAFQRSPSSYVGLTWAGDPHDPLVQTLAANQSNPPTRLFPDNAGSIWENGPLVWNLDSINGYSVLWPSYYQETFDLATKNPASRLFELFNVGYLLTPQPVQQALPSLDPARLKRIKDGPPFVYQIVDPGPRVWVADQAIPLTSGQELAYLSAHDDQLGHAITVTQPVGNAAGGAAPAGTARIVSYANDRVEIAATMTAAGFVVLDDTYFPGWQAEVDGKPAALLRADHTFRAVAVTAGEHEIVMRFRLPGLLAGVVISLGSLAATVLLAVATLAPRRRLGNTRRPAD